MKYIRIIGTFLVIIFAAHLIDTIYVELFKPTLDSLTGLKYAGYFCIVSIPRVILGYCMGTNVKRINRWMWNVKDFK